MIQIKLIITEFLVFFGGIFDFTRDFVVVEEKKENLKENKKEKLVTETHTHMQRAVILIIEFLKSI